MPLLRNPGWIIKACENRCVGKIKYVLELLAIQRRTGITSELLLFMKMHLADKNQSWG